MASSDSDSQSPIFWERLRNLFARDEREEQYGRPSRPGVAISLCVFISFLLWFTFKLQDDYTATLQLPTRVTNLPEDQALTSLPPRTVRVQVQGQGIQLLRLKFSPLSVPVNADRSEIDLSNPLPSQFSNVSVRNVSPRMLELQKEPRATRRIPVQLRARIEAPPTHALMHEPTIEPDSVTVSGGSSIIEEFSYWPTDSLVVEDLRDSLRTRVPLADTLSGLVNRSINSVLVEAEAQHFPEASRELNVRVTGGPEQVVKLEPSTIEVRYRIPVSQYRAAQEAADFFATVSYDQIRADTAGRVRPVLHQPANLEIRDVKITPPTLQYYNVIDSE